MPTYRDLLQAPEFRPIFLTSAVQVAAQTVSGLALGTLIYLATGSALLSALGMFGPSLAQVIGATTLLSAADRLPPRATMTISCLAFGLGTAALALPGLPLWADFAIVMTLGLVASLRGGVSYGLLNEILPPGSYLLGRSVLNMSVGAMQICGFALGGVLVAALSPRGTLLTGAAMYLAAAVVARFGLSRRPPRAAGRPSIRTTWRNNAWLWSSAPRRYVYLALWVPNGLIVGCESLFVSYRAAPRRAALRLCRPGHAGWGHPGWPVRPAAVAGVAGCPAAPAARRPVSHFRPAPVAAPCGGSRRSGFGRIFGQSAAPAATDDPDAR